MAFDLGALVTRMVVQGRAEFERDINAGGTALSKAARQGDEFGLAVGTLGSKTERLGAGVGIVGNELLSMGDRGRTALNQIATGATIAGLATAAFLGLAVARYADYDAAISKSVAVTGAYGEELAAVRSLTLELGASTVFTAKESADGVTELGRAGISTSNILKGALAGSLNLAAAGEVAVAEAAAITASTLNQFSLDGSKAVHVSDLLAAAAGKAQGGVTDLGAGLKQSGLVAAQMGLEVEDSVGALAAFASAGLLGSDAGTSFRTMLLSLSTPTKQQSELLKEYNIQAYDQQGNFVGITSLAGQLKTQLGGLTQQQRDYALGVIFGSDAIRAANILYKEGESGIRDWISAVDDSGYAARIAGINQDNLRGDVEKLGGAFDASLIQFGEGANGVLRDMIQNVTELVAGFTELPDWLQQVLVGGVALTAGLLLFAAAAGFALTKTIEFRQNLAILRAEAPLTAGALSRVSTFLSGPWGIAITAALGVLTMFYEREQQVKALSAAYADTLDQQTGAITKNTREKLAQSLAEDGTYEAARRAGISQWELTEAILGNSAALENVRGKLLDYNVEAGTQERLLHQLGTDTFSMVSTAIDKNGRALDGAKTNWEDTGAAMGETKDTTDDVADAYRNMDGELVNVTDSLGELIDGLREANGQNIDANEAVIQYLDSVAAVGKALAENGANLDLNTEAGRENYGVLLDQADAAQKAADAAFAVNGNYEQYQATLQSARDKLIESAIALGYNADQAGALADQVLRIPTAAEVKVTTDADIATAKLANLLSYVDALRDRASIGIQVGTGPGGINTVRAMGGIDYVRHMAAGGVMSNAGQLAQIRRAGDVTVWAEHETGGEAYIPFAPDRRGRSEAILAQVASIFGGMYVPGGAKPAAEGFTTTTSAPSGGSQMVEEHIHLSVDGRELFEAIRVYMRAGKVN